MDTPETPKRRRIVPCVGLAVASPVLTAAAEIVTMQVVVPWLFGYGSWDFAVHRALWWISAVVGAAGSAAALLRLPVSDRARVAFAAVGFLAVLYFYDWFLFATYIVFYFMMVITTGGGMR